MSCDHDCTTCNGSGVVPERQCNHSGMCPCGPAEVPCPECEGRGYGPEYCEECEFYDLWEETGRAPVRRVA